MTTFAPPAPRDHRLHCADRTGTCVTCLALDQLDQQERYCDELLSQIPNAQLEARYRQLPTLGTMETAATLAHHRTRGKR